MKRTSSIGIEVVFPGAIKDVLTERKRQDAMWGEQNHLPRDYYLILAEEVGELAEAIAEDTVFNDRGTERVREEAVQVAAVALAMVEAIDRREKKTEALGQLEDYLTDRLQSPPDIKLRLPSSVVSGTEAGVALDRVAENGGIHRHSPSCIHNLTPEEQVGLRGYTLDEWVARYGQLPEQITPEQWELPAIEIPPHPSEWSER